MIEHTSESAPRRETPRALGEVPALDQPFSHASRADSHARAPEPVRAESIVAGRLGSDFARLHPELQRRYGFTSGDGVYASGSGTMDRVWNGSALYRPFLLLGAMRNIMFPERGTDVPFTIENWAYRDTFGRETLSLNRVFRFPRERRFDEYIVDVPGASELVIYVGSYQHLAVTLVPEVSDRGGLVLRSGAQRLLDRDISIRFPLFFSATAEIHEWYDESAKRFRLEGFVRNRLLGDVFCCVGSFESSLVRVPSSGVPRAVRPRREQRRF